MCIQDECSSLVVCCCRALGERAEAKSPVTQNARALKGREESERTGGGGRRVEMRGQDEGETKEREGLISLSLSSHITGHCNSYEGSHFTGLFMA